MSESLRSELADVVGPAGVRPDLAALWRDGRRRRRRVRAVPLVAMVVLALAVAALLVVTRVGDEESVVTSGPARCTPPPQRGVVAPPKTVAEFVRGSGDGRVLRPTVVARVEVLRVRRIKVADRSNELLVGQPRVVYERQADVRVIGPVVGARRGRRFVVSDSATVHARETKRGLMRRIAEQQDRLDAIPTDARAQATLEDLQQRLQIFELSERVGGGEMTQPTPCHAFRKGDELILAIRRSPRAGPIYEVTNPNSFFLVDGDQLSPELDAARRSVSGWPDTPLARLARRSSPDELVAVLRAAR